jgi:6-pyruvoyltetrahydropterin/6-carboxytetrahydropterin synthase
MRTSGFAQATAHRAVTMSIPIPQPVQTLHAASAAFEAARHVDVLPDGHRSRRLHGHSFLATVRCALPEGWAPFPGGEVERLRSALQTLVAAWDYRLLNEQLPVPTDENLARWLRDRLGIPGIAQVGIQSTAHEGVDLDASGQAHVWRRYAFQSAHRLPHVAIGHKCGRMHGHGFEVILHANQDLGNGSSGNGDLAVDYDHLDAIWAPFHRELDHACLNDLPGLHNPTSEMLSSWLWERIRPRLPELSWITVYETGSCGASYDGRDYRIWKELTLDSALQLRRAPEGSPLRRLHGHTYTLRLHLAAPLDQVMGWTVDFGDVKALFTPIFKALDHQPPHEIPDLADCDTASLAQWILGKARGQLPQLERVDLYETRGCGAIVMAGAGGPALPL